MNLDTYLSTVDTAVSLASKLGVTPGFVSQWRTGVRPIPIERCAAIEKATDGAVTRKDIRPDDWHLIWPEIADEQCCCAHVSSHSGDSIEAQSIDEAATAPHLSGGGADVEAA